MAITLQPGGDFVLTRVAPVGKLRDEAEHKGQRHLANSWSITAREFEREADVIRDGISRLDAAQQAES